MPSAKSFAATARVLAALAFLAPTAGVLAEEPSRAKVTLVDFSVETSRPAANDLARAGAFVEASDANPAELARRVNEALAKALNLTKAYPGVKTRTGITHTYPNYGKSGRSIESWRMRSELRLETRDIAALSELLGKLQATMAVSQIELLPAPETRRKVEDEATLEAIAAFRAKAKLLADAMAKPYRIRQMAIQGGARPPIVPMYRAAPAAMAEAAAAPIEAGESSVTVTVSGQIELPLD